MWHLLRSFGQAQDGKIHRKSPRSKALCSWNGRFHFHLGRQTWSGRVSSHNANRFSRVWMPNSTGEDRVQLEQSWKRQRVFVLRFPAQFWNAGLPTWLFWLLQSQPGLCFQVHQRELGPLEVHHWQDLVHELPEFQAILFGLCHQQILRTPSRSRQCLWNQLFHRLKKISSF